MELAFLTGAIRRYYLVIVLCSVLGLLPGLLARGGGPDRYESNAVLLVAPPSQSLLQVSFAGDPDRYVAGQLSVLRSKLLADRVAESLDDGSEGSDIAGSVHFKREPLTDVVTIVATTDDPERSQAIADAYATLYLEQLHAQVAGSQEPTIARLDVEITAVRADLADIDAAMVDAMAPYLLRDPIPAIDQVAPGLISEKTILLNQFADLQAHRTELSTGLRVSTEIVQAATLPSDPVHSSGKALLAVGLVAGAFVGLVVASVIARLSPTVLGDGQAEEILRYPVVGALPALPSQEPGSHVLFGDLSPAATRFVESLCVRAEAASEGHSTLTVVVAGSQHGAGTTTLAAVLARRFAVPGSRVLLVDADRRDPDLIARVAAAVSDRQRSAPPNLEVISLSDLAALSSVQPEDSATPRRPDIQKLIAFASTKADVVVFDGGPLMDAVSTVQLAWQCDVVVLAMPRNQRIRSLEVVASELHDCHHVLPVWTSAGSRPAIERWRERVQPAMSAR